MQIPCVYIPGPAPAVSVANTNIHVYVHEDLHEIYLLNVKQLNCHCYF
jgi:hypothetical protein